MSIDEANWCTIQYLRLVGVRVGYTVGDYESFDHTV
jgi:hypothetical protein